MMALCNLEKERSCQVTKDNLSPIRTCGTEIVEGNMTLYTPVIKCFMTLGRQHAYQWLILGMYLHVWLYVCVYARDQCKADKNDVYIYVCLVPFSLTYNRPSRDYTYLYTHTSYHSLTSTHFRCSFGLVARVWNQVITYCQCLTSIYLFHTAS